MAAAILVFVLTQPKEGSIEWHKREYRKAVDRLDGETWADQGWRLLQKVIGGPRSRLSAKEQHDWYVKLKEHRSALLDSGYFVQRRFVITNGEARKVLKTIAGGWRGLIPKENMRYTGIESIQADLLTVVGRLEDMPKWEEVIRKVDVP